MTGWEGIRGRRRSNGRALGSETSPDGSRTSRETLTAADREIRLGIWKIHILFHAAQRDVWGTWLLDELAGHGHQLSPGTLYPALARMERNGWLERKGNATHAHARHVFRTTAEGRRLLQTLQRELTELYEEVVLGREPEPHASERPAKTNSPEKTRARARDRARTRGDQSKNGRV
jgi:DNA-binding PadR family transcriptional regulator